MTMSVNWELMFRELNGMHLETIKKLETFENNIVELHSTIYERNVELEQLQDKYENLKNSLKALVTPDN